MVRKRLSLVRTPKIEPTKSIVLYKQQQQQERDILKGRYILNTALRSLFSGYIQDTETIEGRDMDTEFKYPAKPYSIDTYKWWHQYNGVARRAVDWIPEACWEVDPEVIEKDQVSSTPFEKSYEEYSQEHDVIGDMESLDKAQGIGSSGILFHGFNDVDRDGEQDLSKPVAKLDKFGMIVSPISGLKCNFTRVFDESQFTVQETEENTASPRYGQPTIYSIQFGDEDNTSKTKIDVHWTRVYHSADNTQSSKFVGHSRLESILEYIVDIKKVAGGSAEMYYRAAMPGYSFETQEGLLKDGGAIDIDTDSIKDQISLFMDGFQRFVATVGMTAKSLAPQVTAPNEHVLQYIQLICLSQKAPVRHFMGTESGHLASSQDGKNWESIKKRRRTRYCGPKMLLRYIKEFLIPLGLVIKNKLPLICRWPDSSVNTDLDRADIVLKVVQALVQYMTSEAAKIVPPLVLLMDFFGWSEDKAKDVLAKAEAFMKANPKFLPARPEDIKPVGGNQTGNARKSKVGRPKGKLEKT